MTPNVVSWKEVIKRRSMKESEKEQAGAGSERKAELAEVEYLPAKEEDSEGESDEFAENEETDNLVRDAYSYPGTGKTIVCQVLPSWSAHY